VALDPFETLDGLLVRSRVLEVFLTRLAIGFGLLALIVAIGAIHAHFVRWVRTREREMAIRMALGAPFPAVGREVIASALASVFPGIVGGGFVGWGAARLLSQLLGPLPEISVPLLAVVGAMLLSATLLALTGPLVRARRAQPLELLRGD
jgi:ABC-type antimicrobial peptide transport system permease subunit